MTRKKQTTAKPSEEVQTAAADAERQNPQGGGNFPIVGIGASAGGLAAFEAFFSGLPPDPDPGVAFVLVQHLAPDYKSILTEIIQRCTRMRVFEVEDGMVVQPNSIYIIPPGHDMALLNGILQLLEPKGTRGQHLPIDYFFRSLAQDQHERAIGVILSGGGSDGTLGLRAIKAEGGIVMVQDPNSAEFDSMPRSAIATGLVDYVLAPAEMPPRLITYAKHAFGKLPVIASLPTTKSENALRKIFILLRAQTDHDFSQYKPSTIHRRIDRRMAVHQIDTVDDYVKYLQQTPAEVEALFRDLLIGVTKFFRDPEAFQVLEEKIIPKLLTDKHPGEVIRIWTPGCSTGEEPYSIAMLLVECMEAQHRYHPVQIFATDIDSRGIATARSGTYPSNIAADVTPERLMRFFTPEAKGGGYRVHKNIRDILIFSEQDLIMDPPFSKLDFISCRNLLIYMGAELQKRIIPLFHYSLKPGGILLLGNSEGVGEFGDLFTVLDRKHKIYQRKGDLHGLPRSVLGQFLPTTRSRLPVQPSEIATKPSSPPKPPLRELTEQALLQQVTPAAALINGQGDILYLHGRTGMFLEMVPGEVGINNITKMAREGLRAGLIAGLHKSIAIKETVRCPSLRVKVNGSFITAALTILPVTSGPGVTPESPLYLVIIEEARTGQTLSPHPPPSPEPDADSLIAALRQELRAKDDQLQSTNEELESSTEELKSSNEEMQSVNEELQSTNEELETSKEELQSVNEELSTVNTELQIKISDLTRANNDMNNLLAGTGVGTVFVDHQLRVLRFTPAASLIINLIPGDVGRPVAHIASNLVGYDRFLSDIQLVLDTLVAKDVSVRATNGRWYSMHIQPYRTLENVIEGAVISFVDITQIMEIREQLHTSNEQLRHLTAVVRDAYDAITVQDLEGNTLAWNPGAVRTYGWTESEALKMNVRDRIPAEQRSEELARLSRLGRSEILEPYDTQRLTKDGRVIHVSMVSTALLDESGKMYAIATTERMRVS